MPRPDSAPSKVLLRLGERATRRSVLSRMSRLVLVATGSAFASALLSDVTPAVASHTCAGQYCGINGYPCGDCWGDTTCGSGCYWGNAWTYCCEVFGGLYSISYVDCCGSCSCSASPLSCSSEGSWCYPNPGTYRCTGVFINGLC